ncbi:MAG: hypothetical protein IJD26_09530, partial [Lachnospiraceae bacterium]|nr:hypothetical protein [Lachnospiraceae bacterium]
MKKTKKRTMLTLTMVAMLVGGLAGCTEPTGSVTPGTPTVAPTAAVEEFTPTPDAVPTEEVVPTEAPGEDVTTPEVMPTDAPVVTEEPNVT